MFGIFKKMHIALLSNIVNGYKVGVIKQSEMYDSTYSY